MDSNEFRQHQRCCWTPKLFDQATLAPSDVNSVVSAVDGTLRFLQRIRVSQRLPYF